MASVLKKMGPNIRVEIQNNLVDERMEVDQDEKSEEEGEINDATEIPKQSQTPQESVFPTFNNIQPPAVATKETFITGFNIFDKSEQNKLHERAKRFALKPDEIRVFTDDDLQQLYESLGINSDNRNGVRFEAIHMIGVLTLTNESILDYFSKYAPTSIEWISEDSCNVVWLDKYSSARALHFVSKVVRGMPVRGAVEPLEEEEDGELSQEGHRSILLKNKNREIELSHDDVIMNETDSQKLILKNSVDISQVNIPIPPGYWRLGEEITGHKSILMRFALKIDKLPYQTENLSKYYKKLTGANVGKGIISESAKQQFRGIFSRNKEMPVNEKNPWGSLAKNWDQDAQFREKERVFIPERNNNNNNNNAVTEGEANEEESDSDVQEIVEVKNPKLRVRLGTKRKAEEPEADPKKDETEQKEEEEEADSATQERSKVPRMRMYADEEEEKIKRKKLIQSIKQQNEQLELDEIENSDLRNILRITNKKVKVKEEPLLEEHDLSATLKNRSRQLVFTVDQGHYPLQKSPSTSPSEYSDDENAYALQHRHRSLLLLERARVSPIRYDRSRSRSVHRRQASREEPRRRRTPPGGLRSREDRFRLQELRLKSPEMRLRSPDRRLPTQYSGLRSDRGLRPERGLRSRVRGLRSPDRRLRSPEMRSRSQDGGLRSRDVESRSHGGGLRSRDRGLKALGKGVRSPDRGLRSPDRGLRSVDRRYRGKLYSSRNDEPEDYRSQTTKSKVAVVIKTSKRPTVASAIKSRLASRKLSDSSGDDSSSDGDDSSSESSSSSSGGSSSGSGESSEEESSSESETEIPKRKNATERPGFSSGDARTRLSKKNDYKTPLKVEISNEHYRKAKK